MEWTGIAADLPVIPLETGAVVVMITPAPGTAVRVTIFEAVGVPGGLTVLAVLEAPAP